MICPRCDGRGWIGEWKCILCNGHGEGDKEEIETFLQMVNERKNKIIEAANKADEAFERMTNKLERYRKGKDNE